MVDDELELVRRAFDLDPAESPVTPHRAICARILEEIAAARADPQGGCRTSSGSASRRWTRRRLIALAAIPVAGAMAAAGWALAGRAASQVTAGIGCYAGPSLHASITIVDASGASPVGVCAGLWQSGAVAGRVAAVPPLAACVLSKGGAVGVFPRTTCGGLGLQPLPAGYASAARSYAAMTSQLVDELGQSGTTTCVSEARGVALVREALHTLGYQRWSVSTVGFESSTPCAAFVPDPEDHHITLTGRPTPQLTQAIDSAIEAQRATCHPGAIPETRATALRLFRSALQRAGFANWTVLVDPGVITTRQQPCYDPATDPTTRTVKLSSTMAMDPLT